jgi:ABC-type transport system substrate-binding protein
MLCALMPFLVAPTGVEPIPGTGVATRQGDDWDPRGPYVDSVIFQVITGPDVQVAALIAGDIDCLADNVEASYIDELAANPDIEVTQTERLGFGFMAINCQRYPWTYREFRRALAFAADKYEVATIMWEGLGFALDIPVPASCGVWHNDATTPSFKDPQVAAAQAELADAGFVDLDSDGYVEAPNGDPITFRPMYSIEAPQWGAAMTSQMPYWDAAGIRVEPMPVAFNTLLDIVYTIPRNYDGANYAFGVSPNPLALQNFITDEIANPEGNMLNWANSQYDDYVYDMMNEPEYSDVLYAALQAQQIFAEEVPMLVWYSNWEVNAHRTDKFEGFITIPGWGEGPMNRWTPRKVKLKEGQPERDATTGCGGTFHTIISSAMDSQNPLTSTSVYGNYPLSCVYSSLTGLNDDDHQPTKNNGGLAYDWTSEEVTLPGGAEGMKFTYTLFDNASWHDLGGAAGGLVTAYDVEFSYNYILDNNIPTYSASIPYLNSCVAVDDTTVEITTNGRSYWAFDLTRGWTILPEHIWGGIVSPVTFTNPLPVGSGPFSWYRRIEGEYVELHYWENYHKGIPGHTGAPEGEAVSYLPIYIIVGVVVIIVVLLGSVWYLRRK